jgi:hypothetical protein
LYAQVDTNIVMHPLPDSSAKQHIQNIIVKGNKKTKTYIILREIRFKKGDSLTAIHLADELEQARQLVYNTTLFNEVKIEATPIAANDIIVTVTVKERWYIYPLPQFQIVDRSLNEWLKVYKGSLDRVNWRKIHPL